MTEWKANEGDGSLSEEERRLNEVSEMLYDRQSMPVKSEPLDPNASLEDVLSARLDRIEENARRLERKLDQIAVRLGLPKVFLKQYTGLED